METITSKNDFNQNIIQLKKKFKYMLKGSNMAKYLSVCYAVASFTLAFKIKEDMMYSIFLVISGIAVLAYAIKFLWLRDVQENASTVSELITAIKEYKEQTLKREKLEPYIMAFWLLTLVPVFLEGKKITPLVVMLIIVAFYAFHFFGSYMFNQAKNQMNELDALVNKLN